MIKPSTCGGSSAGNCSSIYLRRTDVCSYTLLHKLQMLPSSVWPGHSLPGDMTFHHLQMTANPDITTPLCRGSCPTCDMVTLPLPQTRALLTGRPPQKPQRWAQGGHHQGSEVTGLPNLQGLQPRKEFAGVRPGGPSLLLEGGVK